MAEQADKRDEHPVDEEPQADLELEDGDAEEVKGGWGRWGAPDKGPDAKKFH